jgi:hypothetical protein
MCGARSKWERRETYNDRARTRCRKGRYGSRRLPVTDLYRLHGLRGLMSGISDVTAILRYKLFRSPRAGLLIIGIRGIRGLPGFPKLGMPGVTANFGVSTPADLP